MDEHTLADFAENMNVQTHPATDAYMRGLVHGSVAKVGRKYVHVTFFNLRAGRFIDHRFAPRDLIIKD